MKPFLFILNLAKSYPKMATVATATTAITGATVYQAPDHTFKG